MGTIFKMSTNGDLVTLFTFAGTNGERPNGLIQSVDGNYYGTTIWGGTDTNTAGLGTVFKMNPGGTLVTLAYFDGTNGSLPQGELAQGADGNLYGTTETGGDGGVGTVFRITTNGALSTLLSFDGTNGAYPMCGLAGSSNGCLYGVTQNGGTNQMGTVFRITPSGAFTLLHSFSSLNTLGENADGAQPLSSPLQAGDGCFYGTTYLGGANGFGTLFKMTADGDITTLYSFGSITNFYGHPLDGFNPNALMTGIDGNFYGTTYYGGTNNNIANNGDGTVFRLSVPMPSVFKKITQTNGVCSLTWSAVAGQVYQLQFTANLNLSNWIDLGGTNMATDGTMSATDDTGSVPRRFYRVVLP